MNRKEKIRTCFSLFKHMFFISAFTFGGGFVIVSLMKKKFVDELKWLEEQEMLDMTAIAQSCPGAIAVNASIMAGWRICGFWGCIFAVLGTMLPPITLLSIISLFYHTFASSPPVAAVLRGMQCGVAAVITDVTINLGSKALREKSRWSLPVMLGAFICTFVLKINVIWIILAAILIGILRFVLIRKEVKQA